MIRIYCLVDPRTNGVFYVGATRRTLYARLISHLGASNVRSYSVTKSSDRNQLIKELRHEGLRPAIYCLMIVSSDLADYAERHFYNYFLSQGADLLQDRYMFTYQGHYCKK